MRIGFDGSCLSNRRGFGRFSRRILEALSACAGDHEIVVVLDRPSEPYLTIPEGCRRLVVDVREAPSAAASAKGRRGFRDMLAMGRAVARARLDLMYFPATYTYFPTWNVPRLVVTLHDTLALAHPDLVFPTHSGRWSWMLKEHAAVRRADRIVTVSESSRRELQAWFKLPGSRFRVVSEAPDPVFRPATPGPESDVILRKYGLSPAGRYLIYVGGLSPHKNLPRLIAAFAQAASTDDRLILVGDLGDVFHSHVPEIRRVITMAGVEDRVLLAGYVPDDELRHLYSRAYALVLPSLMEGFGLPAVEAMACGIPVVSSRAGSLPEVVGDAGLFFDPIDVATMALTLGQILCDRAGRDALARRALDRSSLFSWNRAGRSLLSCFQELNGSTSDSTPSFDTPDSSIRQAC